LRHPFATEGEWATDAGQITSDRARGDGTMQRTSVRILTEAALLATTLAAGLAGFAQSPRGPGAPSLEPAGQVAGDRVVFRGVGLSVESPGAADWIPYAGNRIIAGKNLYAPSLVDTGAGWYVYCGGWRDPRDENDRIYLAGTPDYSLRGEFTPTNVVIDNGFYVHACDPSVVRLNEKAWVMALTVFRDRDWIAISVSPDGVKWSPNTFRDRAHEVRFHKAKVTTAARPALLYDDTNSRWELYFDGTVDGKAGFYLAYSEDQVPRDFVIQGAVADSTWADAEVKRVGGRYFVAYRRPEKEQFPWVIRWAESKDGRWFTERGMLLTPDADNPFDDMGVTNPGLAVDRNGVIRALLYGGTTVKSVNNHKIGVAYPQLAAEAISGNVTHGHRQATDPGTQVVATYQYKGVDRVRVRAPGGRLLAELAGRFGQGSAFQFRE
jgi:hypothetical protein